ncbi:NAD-dependent succinate-semialdehyde dehydrogenase [Cupriavidus sp. 30B13]|uniref:NAD-dependent succinate-semialdehyde dehydrogenase n=1 Tax=Cupriavidus sp. 30B13 TaxID=3384241 RepID=UPI003B9058D1
MAYETVNPATGATIETFPPMSDAEVLAALKTADDSYQRDWRHRPVSARAAVMARAAAILREKRDEYARYLTLEMGKLVNQGYYEIDLSADILDYYARRAESFLRPAPLAEAPGAVVVTEPVGVILAIEPWNFPYYQLARVAGPQIMAGNVLMVKHAPNVPQCALAFARLFEEAGAPAGVYTNLFCSVEQVGALIDDFRVRGVTLTGSERAGASVAERAGRNLKKVVLELGGSDPMIVLEDAPLEQAAEQAIFSRMINMGQACVSSKRIIVVGKERGERILAHMTQRIGNFAVGDPADPATEVGPVVSERALEGLLAQVEGARHAGARVVLGGRRIDRPGFYMEPTIVTGIGEDNPLYQQETFGPVLSYYVVDSEEDAIRLANATRFGLGASVFSGDVERARRVAARIEAGMVFINSAAYTGPEVPFGGVKNSGFGRELSELGIGEFVNKKLVRVAAAG